METIARRMDSPAAGYLARPMEGRWPGVLLHFEVFGINRHIETVCNRLASEGYVVFAPDYYAGKPQQVASNLVEAIRLVEGMTDEKFNALVGSAAEHLQSLDFVVPGKLGSLGFCMGGRISYFAACFHPNRIACAVCYYPGGIGGVPRFSPHTLNPLTEATRLNVPVLLFFGDSDPYIPLQDAEAIRAKLDDLKKPFRIKIYPGAGHGFFCEDREDYRPEAAEYSWRLALGFLKEHLKPAAAE